MSLWPKAEEFWFTQTKWRTRKEPPRCKRFIPSWEAGGRKAGGFICVFFYAHPPRKILPEKIREVLEN